MHLTMLGITLALNNSSLVNFCRSCGWSQFAAV